jgi:hypothetical protein
MNALLAGRSSQLLNCRMRLDDLLIDKLGDLTLKPENDDVDD